MPDPRRLDLIFMSNPTKLRPDINMPDPRYLNLTKIFDPSLLQ